ncbi:hypothetical protein CFP71_19860 [Amycolatopsis thailandensis]|uniref:Uncharacterized protein n=1 Tax=Amycolatopsis thailandensis TaxID=589330 RepID=A0A229S6I7_9PSEU|nr:hypothetical protein CFP71_19860 [Amycolatopsis thailandensis]
MPVPDPSLSRDTTALIALLGVRAIKAVVNDGRWATEGVAQRKPSVATVSGRVSGLSWKESSRGKAKVT